MKIVKKTALPSVDRKSYSKNVDFIKKKLSNQKIMKLRNLIKKYTEKNFFFFFAKLISNRSQNLIKYIQIKKFQLSFFMKELIETFLLINFNKFQKYIAILNLKKLNLKKITIIQKKNTNLSFFRKKINHPISFKNKIKDIFLILKTIKIISKKKLFEIKKQKVSNIFINNIIPLFSYFDFFSKDLLNNLKLIQSKSKVKKLKKYSLMLPFFKRNFLKMTSFYSLLVLLGTKVNSLFFYCKKPKFYLLTNKTYSFFRKYLIQVSKKQKLLISPSVFHFMLANDLKKFSAFKGITPVSPMDLKRSNLKTNFSFYGQISKKEEKARPNQHYFYYIFKKRLSQIKFDNINRFNLVTKTISLFRYLLLKKILRIEINKEISKKFIQELIIFNNYKI